MNGASIRRKALGLAVAAAAVTGALVAPGADAAPQAGGAKFAVTYTPAPGPAVKHGTRKITGLTMVGQVTSPGGTKTWSKVTVGTLTMKTSYNLLADYDPLYSYSTAPFQIHALRGYLVDRGTCSFYTYRSQVVHMALASVCRSTMFNAFYYFYVDNGVLTGGAGHYTGVGNFSSSTT